MGVGCTKAEYIMVEDDAGMYSIPAWALGMTQTEFETQYQVDTVEPIETLYGWGQWQTAIRVRCQDYGLNCTLFTTLEFGEVVDLGTQSERGGDVGCR
jgi:hypothetical protein